jgi:drug/metabolite transporter (DMT)-like permease
MNILRYISVALLWGSSWFAIKLQLGIIPETVSLAWRFFIASFLFFLFCLVLQKKIRLPFFQLKHIFIQGILLFCLNYFFIYLGTNYVTSGLVAILFSNVTLFVIFNGYFFFGKPIRAKVLVGSIIGIVGLILIFQFEFTKEINPINLIKGIIFISIGTYFASLGMLYSGLNQERNIPLIQSNAYGMLFGASIMMLIALCFNQTISLDLSFSYISSLLFLAFFGSVLGFSFYLSLLGKIGADKASYVNILTPVVALSLSTLFENYLWNVQNFLGLLLIIIGNIIILSKKLN